MKKLKAFFKWLLPYTIPTTAGAALVLSFAPFHITLLSFLSVAVLLYSLSGQSKKQPFIRGGLYGLGLFGFGASWIYVSIYNFGGESMIISGVITCLFVLVLALFPALLGWLLNTLFKKDNVTRNLLAFPVLWVAVEILRGWIFTGFPWLFLGYTQLDTHLMWYAPVGSVWLVSWAVAFNAAILYEIYKLVQHTGKKRNPMLALLAAALVVWIGAAPLRHYAWTQPVNEHTAALIQGNIAQSMRWDPQSVDHIASTYYTLTAENIDADLIVWPESAIPSPLPYSRSYFAQVNQLAVANGTTVVAGVPIKVNDRDAYYNAMVALGQGSGSYAKQQLVPFGEYVPFERWLRGMIQFFDLPMSNFVEGPTMAQAQLFGKDYQIAPAVCYEIAYPLLMRKLTQNSGVILTVSNDAWFGRSFGPKQHLQIAQYRALETGRWVLRATNTGITAIVNQEGSLKETAHPYEQEVLRGSFQTMTGQTPWMKFGPWSLFGFLAVIFGIAMFRESKANKRKKKAR